MTPDTARLRIVFAALLFSTGGAGIKLSVLTGPQVACLRSGVAAVTVLLLLPSSRRGWRRSTLVIGATYAATMILFVLANKLTTAASTIYLQAVSPLYLLLLGPWLLREPVRRRDLMFMAAMAAGMALFFIGSGRTFQTAPDPVRGNLLAALSGFCWALTVTGLRWAALGESRADGGGSVEALVVAGNALAFFACLPMALPLPAMGPIDWTVILYLGALQIGLAYILLARAMRQVHALDASLLLLVEPVLNPIWAWLIHAEAPGPWALLGGAIILAATAARTLLAARRGGEPSGVA
ncbi:MAG TPA: DMT family transporter [Candidatus Polarisedimenticolia bacterium]|nr:DMT family transporter [Candidatus Polarisedimenticolia bacterium]